MFPSLPLVRLSFKLVSEPVVAPPAVDQPADGRRDAASFPPLIRRCGVKQETKESPNVPHWLVLLA